MFKKAKDPISCGTHFIGACCSLVGLLFFIFISLFIDIKVDMLVGAMIFAVSSIALYLASSLYHYYNGSKKIEKILKKLDHSMIYVLIVGTYTPVVLSCMPAPRSYYFLGVLWGIALIGVILKIVWINAPRTVSTIIYLLLGWSVVFDFQSFQNIPTTILTLIACGGMSYSLGAIIYIIKKPNISVSFGFHELFHLFVMLGSFLHYIAILLLMI